MIEYPTYREYFQLYTTQVSMKRNRSFTSVLIFLSYEIIDSI